MKTPRRVPLYGRSIASRGPLGLIALAALALIVSPWVSGIADAAHTIRIAGGPTGDPNPVAPGGAVKCSFNAVDSEDREMKYLWSAPAGSFDDPKAAQPTWTAPAQAGQYEIKVTVTTEPKGVEVLLGAPQAQGTYTQVVAGATAPAAQGGQAPDLVIQPDWIVLAVDTANQVMQVEPAADQQCIGVVVANTGRAGARGVQVQFSASPPGGQPAPIGNPVAVGDIKAGDSAAASLLWNLGGGNLERYTIVAQATAADGRDADDTNNQAQIVTSIYFARSGGRAYGWQEDSYRFGGYPMQQEEVLQSTAAVVAAVVDSMGLAQDVQAMVAQMLLPPTFLKLSQYFDASSEAGADNHAHGMAASAETYFANPALKPVTKTTSKMTQQEAAPAIATIQQAQICWPLNVLLRTEYYMQTELTPDKTLQTLRTFLRDKREAPMVELFGSGWGHAVLAYKLVEVQGRDAVVYTYDPMMPATQQLQDQRVMPHISLGQGSWSAAPGDQYATAGAQWIGAHEVFAQITPDQAAGLVRPMRRMLYDLASDLSRSGRQLVMLSGPAEGVLLDVRGRRTGMVNGQLVNEIPKAEVLCSGWALACMLPPGAQYLAQIRGTDNGTILLSLLHGESDTRMDITAFVGVRTKRGSVMNATLGEDGSIEGFRADGAPIDPTVKGFLGSGDSSVWGVQRNRPPSAPTVSINPPNPTASDGLYCNAIGSVDLDGDPVEYLYQWYQNGQLADRRIWPGLSAQWTSDGDVWRCVVTPTDGTDNGPTGEATVTVRGAGSGVEQPPQPGTGGWQTATKAAAGYTINIPPDWHEDTTNLPEGVLQRFRLGGDSYVLVDIHYANPGALSNDQFRAFARSMMQREPYLLTQGVQRDLNVPAGMGLEYEFTGALNNMPIRARVRHLLFGTDYYELIGVTHTGEANLQWPVITEILTSFAYTGPANVVPQQARGFAITEPTQGQVVGDTINIRGTAQPGSKVRVTINYWFRVLVAGWARLSQTEVVADANGDWEVKDANLEVSIFGRSSKYEIMAELLDGAGNAQATEKVQIGTR